MENDQLPTKTLPSVPTSQQSPTPRKQIAAILARLSLHYWRPDYSPEQARMVIEDYLVDLERFTPTEIERACMAYRRLPDSKFFPKSGELIDLLTPKRQAWDMPPSRLPSFRSPPALTGPRPKLKSVGDVLREHGHRAAAERYEVNSTLARKGAE